MPEPRRVKGPDGKVHVFPADATDAEIGTALEAKQTGTTARQSTRTWTDTAVDALPMVGGMVGGALGGLSGLPTLGLGSVPGAMIGAGTLGAGGEAARQSINRWRGKPAPTTPGEAATDIALQGGGQAAMEGLGLAAGPILTKGAQTVYRGYLKPSLARTELGNARRIVKTALEEALPMTAGGEQKAQRLVTELNAQVENELANQPGKTIDLHDVAERLRAWAKRRYFVPGQDMANYDAALKVASRLDDSPALGLPPLSERILTGSQSAPVDLPTANTAKRALAEGVGNQWGIKSGAEATTEKMGQSFLRHDLAHAAPDTVPLLARESPLIATARALARATGRDENRDAILGTRGIASYLGARDIAAGAFGAGEYARNRDPYAAAAVGLATRLALEPAVMTSAAIVAYWLGKQATTHPRDVADVARAAVQAAMEVVK